MSEMMTEVLSHAVDHMDAISPLGFDGYDPRTQYVAPFATESAMPGNYFMHMDLTTPLKEAALTGEESLGVALAEVTMDVLQTVDAVDIEACPSPEVAKAAMVGTAEMLWRRWGVGGWGEAKAITHFDVIPAANPIETLADKGIDVSSMSQADRSHGIDIVGADGTTYQVKTKDTDHKPTESDKKDADVLVFVNKDSGTVEQIA